MGAKVTEAHLIQDVRFDDRRPSANVQFEIFARFPKQSFFGSELLQIASLIYVTR